MAQKKSWEEATQKSGDADASRRLQPFVSFRQRKPALLGAVIDRVMPQDDRAEGRTIPILPVLDERLYKNSLNGFRYEDMPPDQEAYRLAIKAIEEMAQERFRESFVDSHRASAGADSEIAA